MRFSVLHVCAFAAIASPAFALSNFTTSNGNIYDPSGNQYVARGVNIPGQNYWTGHDPTPDASMIANDWGFNMVRVMSQPIANWSAPGANINLDNIINAYTSKGIVVVLSTHESTGTYYTGSQLTQAATWYASEAAKYVNNPYVWFNTGNEPGNEAQPAPGAPGASTWDQWTPDGQAFLNMNQTIISAIRNTGNQNMVMVDGTNYGQDQAWDDLGNLVPKHSAILTYGPILTSEYSNVVFDTHIYGEWSSPGAITSRLPQYIQAVKSEKLPLIFGEYGATTDGDYVTETSQFLAIANQYNIGHVAWAWADSGDWDLTTSTDPNAIGTSWQVGGGYLINSATNPTNLTPFGQMVWTDSHALLAIPEPASLSLLCLAALPLLRRRRSV